MQTTSQKLFWSTRIILNHYLMYYSYVRWWPDRNLSLKKIRQLFWTITQGRLWQWFLIGFWFSSELDFRGSLRSLLCVLWAKCMLYRRSNIPNLSYRLKLHNNEIVFDWYWTKHHPAKHHKNICNKFLTPMIMLEMLHQEQAGKTRISSSFSLRKNNRVPSYR